MERTRAAVSAVSAVAEHPRPRRLPRVAHRRARARRASASRSRPAREPRRALPTDSPPEPPSCPRPGCAARGRFLPHLCLIKVLLLYTLTLGANCGLSETNETRETIETEIPISPFISGLQRDQFHHRPRNSSSVSLFAPPALPLDLVECPFSVGSVSSGSHRRRVRHPAESVGAGLRPSGKKALRVNYSWQRSQ